MKELSPFGVALDKAMKELNITKKELSERMKVSPSSVTQYFEGSPSIDTALRISAALGIKLYQLLAFMETGIPIIAWDNFEAIMNLPVPDRTYILRQIDASIDYILEKRDKK